jgi:hypothetical protein
MATRSKRPMGTIYPKKIQETIHGEADKKIQLGYDKVEIRREEGEKWTDEYGKEWEMKDGITRSIPKLSDIRVPLFCPKCGSIMGKRSKDTDVFYKFGFCLDCLLDRDFQMKKDGTFDEYEKNYIESKKKGFYEDAKNEIESYLTQMREKGCLEYVTSDGQVKKMDVNINDLIEFWEKELNEVNKELEKVNNK